MKKQKFVFLGFKKGTSAKGNPYKMLEVSSNHRNFTCRVSDSFDEKSLSTLSEYDEITIDFEVVPDYDGNATAIVVAVQTPQKA